MTAPRLETIEREKDKLYLTDAELYRWLGIPRARIAPVISVLEAKHGFPRKQQLFGGRRYRPAVQTWLDRYHGLIVDTPPTAERTSWLRSRSSKMSLG